MGRFSLKGQMPVLELKYRKGPMCFVKVGDRALELRQVYRVQGKYWIIEDGVFELDGEYEYRLFDQSVLFYNLHNSKPISLEGVRRVQELYREGKMHELVDELEKIDRALVGEAKKYKTPIQALRDLTEAEEKDKGKDGKKEPLLSKSERKFLIDYRFFEKNDLKLQNIKKFFDKKIDKDLSHKVTTVFPSLIFFSIAMTLIISLRYVNPFKLFPWLWQALGGG